MIMLFILNVLVYQNGDTLLFTEQDSVIDQWILGETIQQIDSLEATIIKRAKVSSDNEKFLIHTEHYTQGDLLKTEIVLYNNYREKVWRDSASEGSLILFRLSNIYDNLFIIVRSPQGREDPILYTIKDNKKEIIIEQGEWDKIIDYSVSPNERYLLLHTKNPYSNRSWDYIYFIDLENKEEWQYLFPMCASCKRGKIDVKVDDSGISEVICKGQHRVFSKEGKLIDFFYSFE